MIKLEIRRKNRHHADTGRSKLTKQTCQIAHAPDMIVNSFLELEICL
jgi:hypothetical protein